MMEIYSEIKIPCYIVSCVGTVIIALTLRSMPLVVGWIIVCVLIGCLLTQNKIKNARLAYINACQLKAYEHACEMAVQKNRNKKVQAYWHINLADIYLIGGKPQEAIKVLLALKAPFPKGPSGVSAQVAYDHKLVGAYIQTKQYEAARETLLKMKDTIEKGQLEETLNKTLLTWYQNRVFELAMEEGEFEGAKAHFVKLLDEPQSLVGKVYV